MIRIKVERNTNYTTISNIILKDKRVGLAERGLFTTLMALPENFEISILSLCEILKESKDKIGKTINNLIELGYIKRTQIKDKNNRFVGYKYSYSDLPIYKNKENFL